MKRRVIQDGQGPGDGVRPPSAADSRPRLARNVAARMGHWSATHRKTAIWGWLVFVVVAVMAGITVGQNKIHGADQFSGEAARAEHALEDAGLRPNTEHVFIQSEKLTIREPQFRSVNRAGDRPALAGRARGERGVAADR
jgi:hypothetical protein